MKEETRYFYGTIHPERATNEWQRKNALPARYDTATPAEQAKMREYYNVTDDECEEMRKIYAAFPPHMLFRKALSAPDEWLLISWEDDQDEAVREAIWLLEQLGGFYEGYRDKFLEDWNAGEYESSSCWTIPDYLMEVESLAFSVPAVETPPPVPPDEPLPFDVEELEGKNHVAKSDRA